MQKFKERGVSSVLINRKFSLFKSSKKQNPLNSVTYRQDFKRNKSLYLMMIPYALVFFMFVIVPILASFVLSFTSYNMFQTPKFIGMSNYINLFIDDSVFMTSMKNTFIFALLTGPLSYFLCLLLAWFINELPKLLRVIMTLVFYAPSLSSSTYFIWKYIFSGDAHGVINSFLITTGLINEPVQWLADESTNLIVLMIVQLWMSLGTSFLSFIAGFQGIDSGIYEAGEVDGIKNRFQELIYLTFPMLKPQLLFSAIMQIVNSFSVSTISSSLCGFPSTNYSAHTVVLHIQDYGTIRYEMGYACAISVVLFIIMILVRKLIDLALRYVPDA